MDSHFALPHDRFFRRKKLDTDLDLRKIANARFHPDHLGSVHWPVGDSSSQAGGQISGR
jgi:hypothetical protein